MSYIDRSVIVAALDPADPRSIVARKVLESGGYKVVSELVLLELASVLSRRRKLITALARKLHSSREVAVVAAVLYVLKRFDLRYRSLKVEEVFTPFGSRLEEAPPGGGADEGANVSLKKIQ